MKYLTIQEIKCVGPDSCEQRLEPLMDALLDVEAADAAITDLDLAADVSTGCSQQHDRYQLRAKERRCH